MYIQSKPRYDNRSKRSIIIRRNNGHCGKKFLVKHYQLDNKNASMVFKVLIDLSHSDPLYLISLRRDFSALICNINRRVGSIDVLN